MPAISAWRSESSPSVAETCVESTCTNSTGRAPVWRTSARSFASWIESRPLIWALPPEIPSASCGSVKSMIGKERISPSRTIAKLCAKSALLLDPCAPASWACWAPR